MRRPQPPIMLLPERAILPNEHTDSEALECLFQKISEEGIWTHPILLERDSLAVMDGHHRLAVARLLGLKLVPAMLYSYDQVKVEGRRGLIIGLSDILQCSLTTSILPPKTTRHTFPELISCSIAIGDLN